MAGQSTAEWPEFPFCGKRCRTIDLGRWLGETYRIEPAGDEGEPPAGAVEETDVP
jgi:endogenous inhibitor of DNA gyrase (YacG/DUF329 family)